MSKSEFDKAKAQIRNTVGSLFLVAFLLGVAHQMILPLIYAAGVLSAIWLLRLTLSRWLRR